MGKKSALSDSMTETEFDNGYWYATELREFAVRIGIPSANKLRKDELEKALKHFLRTGELKALAKRGLSKPAVRDVDRGLSLDLPVVNYTSNKETKEFIEREAAKLEPGFKRASGTRYLLNRWREEQLSIGKRITYRDLVTQAIEFNKTNYDWTTHWRTGCASSWSIRAVATHEFGHAFGLAHVTLLHPNQTMSPLILPCQNSQATLGRGDVLGLRAKY